MPPKKLSLAMAGPKYDTYINDASGVINFDSRVKSKFWDYKSVFKMRKIGIKNTYDAGVNFTLTIFVNICDKNVLN